ncbi:hypothetical protein AB3S75_003121 [Citrus x aurantiifolia]
MKCLCCHYTGAVIFNGWTHPPMKMEKSLRLQALIFKDLSSLMGTKTGFHQSSCGYWLAGRAQCKIENQSYLVRLWFKSDAVITVILFIVFQPLEGKVAAKLPFKPFRIVMKMSHRGLQGDDGAFVVFVLFVLD